MRAGTVRRGLLAATTIATAGAGISAAGAAAPDTTPGPVAFHLAQTSALTVTLDDRETGVDGGYDTVWVDFGDATPRAPVIGSIITHSYATAGTYQVTLSVTWGSASGPTTSATRSMTVSATVPPKAVHRYAGSDRYDTGVLVSHGEWEAISDSSPTARHPQAVVLARGDAFADALTGVPLAAKVRAPLLLTPTMAWTLASKPRSGASCPPMAPRPYISWAAPQRSAL